MWADQGIHYVHYHPASVCDRRNAADLASSLLEVFAFDRRAGRRPRADHKKSAIRSRQRHGAAWLALDHLELILAAHVMQRTARPSTRGPPERRACGMATSSGDG